MKQSATFSLKGTTYYSAPDLLSRGALSPGTTLSLRHERNNSHDANAVAVHVRATGAKLGHLPREYAPKYASLVDQGKIIEAKINSSSTRGSRPVIHVTITYDPSVLGESSVSAHVSSLSEGSGVYSIRNNHSAREYIGSSSNVKRRIAKHLQDLRSGVHGNRLLQEDFIQYGAGAFSATMLSTCSSGSEAQMEAAIIAQKLKSGIELYNITLDGQGVGFRPRYTGEARSISDKARPITASSKNEPRYEARATSSGCLAVIVVGILVATPLIPYGLSFLLG